MAKKYVKSIKFSQSGETYYIRDAEAKETLDTLSPKVDNLESAVAGKQDKLTSANAGTNVTITEESGVLKINATGGSGTGAVESVNGKTGEVTLTASDVGAATSAQGALADTAVQPAAIEDMETKTHAGETYAAKSLETTVSTHTGNNDIHVTASDKLTWSAKQDALPDTTGKDGKYLKVSSGSLIWAEAGGGSGGTSDYSDLDNKPEIEGHTLKAGANTAASLGLATSSQLSAKQDTLVSGTNIKSINSESLLGSGNIEVLTSSALNNYYTKTEADAEFLTSNLGVENAGKLLDVDSEGNIETSDLDSTKLVQTEEHTFDTTVTSSTEVPALAGHLYKGKRYDVGATADDGTTLTSTARKVSNYILLNPNGQTYLPAVWEAGGANYTEMCLYAAVNGGEPANNAQALIYTKACGSMSQQTSGVVKPLTLIADTSVDTYTFDTENQIMRFNPEYVQYIRTYVTDDSTIARAEYTTRTVETLDCIDITNGIIKSDPEPESLIHEIGGFIGSVFYKNLTDDSEGWVVFQNTGTVSISPATAPSAAMVAKIDSSITTSKPTRFYTNPIALKYGGISFDVNDEDCLDFNGVGYFHVAFLDASWNVVGGTEGINGSGRHAIKHLEIIRSEVAQSISVVTDPASPTQDGDITSQIITVPTSYQYVIACIGKTISSCTQAIASTTMTKYTYIDEPEHGPQKYRESETFIGQMTDIGCQYNSDPNKAHVFRINNGQSVNTGVSTNAATAMDDSSVTTTTNCRVYSEPIEIDMQYDGFVIDDTLLDMNGNKFCTIMFLDENYVVKAAFDGVNQSGTYTILHNQFIKDSSIQTAVIDRWDNPASSGANIDGIIVRYPESTDYKYVMVCLTSSWTGTPEAFKAENLKVQYHFIGEYEDLEPVVTKLSDYIDSKIPTAINDKYTWSRMYGANVCLFGGSFATATYGSKAHEYWQEHLGINLTNYAVGGAGIIQNVGTTPMQTQVANMVSAGKKYDLYIIWFSTNDQRKVGEVWTAGSSQTIQGNTYAGQDFNAEVIGAVDDTNRTSQSGGINWCMNQIYTFDPNAKIIMFTSMRHFASSYGYNDLDETGPSVRHFADAQIRSCEYWGVPYVDQYRVWGVNTLNKTTFVRSDNLHPTDAGYLKIAALQTELMANM